MSFLSSIFPSNTGVSHNGGNSVQAAALTPAAPATPATPATPAAGTETQTTPTSHLDQYAALWQTPTSADGKPVAAPADPMSSPVFNFDPRAIQTSASKMDFTAGLAPDLATKALGGDATALSELINGAVRNAVVGVTLSQGNLINQAVATNNERVTQALPRHIKSVQLMETPNENPVLDHPAVQPLVGALKQMAFAKDPNASPAAVAKMVNDYISGLGTALHEQSPTTVAAKAAASKAAGEQDWSLFAE
jgi:hypothetical protein